VEVHKIHRLVDHCHTISVSESGDNDNYEIVVGHVLLYSTRHRVSTSMYSLTFRIRVATPAQYGRNGTASLQITSHTQQAGRFYRWCVRACVVRALGLADYRWALPHISIMLPWQRIPCTDCKSAQ